MELFPNLEIGWLNGWLLIVGFFGAYGILLVFFPKQAVARLYDRIGQRDRRRSRRFFGAILMVLMILLMGLTPLKIGEGVFVIGIGLYSLGLIGFVIALFNFKNTPADQPVTRGLYRISRHPQQFAVSVAFLGIGIAIGSWPAFALMILGVIGGHFKLLAEEQACLEQYGESYRIYMERIPRYLLFF